MKSNEKHNEKTMEILNVLADVIGEAQSRMAAAEQPKQTTKPAEKKITPMPTGATHKFELFSHPEFGTIQTTVIDGKPYFRANSIVASVGYSNNVSNLKIPNRVKIYAPNVSGKGSSIVTFIPESGVKYLVERRKVHELGKFQQWITNEVVPTIAAEVNGSKQDETKCVSRYPAEDFRLLKHPVFGELVVIMIGNKLYYRAADVAYMLGYSCVKGAAKDLQGRIDLAVPAKHHRQRQSFIPRAGVEQMLDNRKLLYAPATKALRDYLFDNIPKRMAKPGAGGVNIA